MNHDLRGSVENATKKEDIKESHIKKKKEEEHKCSDVNDRVYKQKKKGKLKANGGILLK